MKIKTEIKVEGINKLDTLLKKQQELLDQFTQNVLEIEKTVYCINVALSVEDVAS